MPKWKMITKIAVMGCGSLGTILSAYLIKAGLDVTMVDVWEEHINALKKNGATVTGFVNMNVPVEKACTPDKMEGTFDLIIYMAKQTFNDTAIPQMVNHCHSNTIICTCQNGIPEYEVMKYYPEEKIMGCTVGWPATLRGPGVSELTKGTDTPNFEFHIGRLNGEIDDTLEEVAAIFNYMCTGRTHITNQLIADRWSKLLINATLSGMSAVSNNTFGYVLRDHRCAECVVRMGRECVKVCNAQGYYMPVIYGIDFNKIYDYSTKEEEEKVIQEVSRILGTTSEGKASMLQDLEKGSRCEVDFINGTVSEAGDRAGIDTPYCDTARKLIKMVEMGELPLDNHVNMMPNTLL